MRSFALLVLGVSILSACSDSTSALDDSPRNLTYRVEPSGDPSSPAGVLLTWDPVLVPDLEAYQVYSSPTPNGEFSFRASTTSISFHDLGQPDLEYYVTAFFTDGDESEPSNSVIIDERLRLARPAAISSISLDGAVHLSWLDNAFEQSPDGFEQYRVYSTTFSIDDDLCSGAWALEGTTVSPSFLASALPNGQPRCFVVSAESVEGFESLWSDIIADTPRPDARNVIVFAFEADPGRSGFRFFADANGDGLVGRLELGIVAAGDRPDVDFRIFRDANDDVFLEPVRFGTQVVLYGNNPVEDLTSIDFAPVGGYETTPIQALPRWGYVFEMLAGDPFARFGAIRVTHVNRDYLIFDWSYQTDPGNPELSIHGGLDG